MNSPFQSQQELERFEARLRAGAAALAREPAPDLRARVGAALRATEHATEHQVPRDHQRLGTWVAAAAAALVLFAAGWLSRATLRPEPRARQVVAFSRGIFGAGSRVLELPAAAEGNLRLEARRLLLDTTRMAAGVVRGLPAPLRTTLERM